MVTLQILLKKEWRTPDCVRKAREAVARAGMILVSSGAASLTVDVSEEDFLSMFGAVASQAIADANRAGLELNVPPQLAEFVEDVSIAPKHLYFQPRPEDRKPG